MMAWQDRHGSAGAEHSRVRVLKDVPGLASVWASRPDEEVIVPAGTLATVLYVNEDTKIVGVEFSDIEGNVFGNVSWDDVEIVPLPRINAISGQLKINDA